MVLCSLNGKVMRADLALSLFSSFGYFEKHEDNIAVLTNIYKSLLPQDRFVLQLKAKEVTAKTLVERDWEEVDDLVLLTERRIENNWNWIALRLVFFDGRHRQEHLTGMWLYAASELIGMLKEVGFSQIQVLGDFDGSSYDDKARKTVLIANK